MEKLHAGIKCVHVNVYDSLTEVALIFEFFDLWKKEPIQRLYAQLLFPPLTMWSTCFSIAPEFVSERTGRARMPRIITHGYLHHDHARLLHAASGSL